MPTKSLINGHKSFKIDFKNNEKLYLDLAKKGQKPATLWIGCSDSRVVPEQIMGANPGDLFVHRNIANIIPPVDSNENCTSSAIKYAVNELNVSHIVVCGHTECGGMKAVINSSELTNECTIHRWISHAFPAKERTLAKNIDENELYLETIKENVILQKENLLTLDYVSEKYKTGELKIHCWLYDLHTGDISRFDSDKDSWSVLP